jgi:hypothetical protein
MATSAVAEPWPPHRSHLSVVRRSLCVSGVPWCLEVTDPEPGP